MSTDSYGFWMRLRGAVDEFVDPVLVDVYPRALASARSPWSFRRAGPRPCKANFTTGLRTTAPATNVDETAFFVGVPIRYRLNENVILEGGGRWAERAPALAASDFGFHQRQLWASATLTVTTSAVPGWTGR